MSRLFLLALMLVAAPAATAADPKPADGKPDNPYDKLDRDQMTPLERDTLPDIAVATATLEQDKVKCFALSVDGKLAAGTDKGDIVVWDLTGGAPKEFATAKLPMQFGEAERIAFSPDGKRLAAGIGLHVFVWNVTADGLKPFDSKHVGRIEGMAWSPDGKLIACGANVGYLLAVHAKGIDPVPAKFTGASSCYTFSADGSLFASVYFTPERNGGAYGSQVMFWRIGKGKVSDFAMITQDWTIRAIALSPDAKQLATGSTDNKVRIWDLGAKKAEVRATMDASTWMTHLAFTADGRQLIGLSANYDLMLYDAATGKLEKSWGFKKVELNPDLARAGVLAAATSPDGRYVALSSRNNKIVVARLPVKPAEKK